jgi:hypothetical protein
MIDDRDVWQDAVLIVKRYCDDVMQVLEEGDMAGAETWPRAFDCIVRLQWQRTNIPR